MWPLPEPRPGARPATQTSTGNAPAMTCAFDAIRQEQILLQSFLPQMMQRPASKRAGCRESSASLL
jgi:hypothetical protein